MKKRLLCLLLTLALILGLGLPVSAGAPSASVREGGSVRNPLYQSLPAPERVSSGAAGAEDTEDTAVAAARKAAIYVSVEEAADQLRQAMAERREKVTLYIHTSAYWYRGGGSNWFSQEFFPMTYSQALAKGPYDGDYLRWSWYTYDWEKTGQSGNDYTLSVTLEYYTTAAEEQYVRSRVEALVSELRLSQLSAYDAYAAVNDYIAAHVTYAYDKLRAIYDRDKTNDDYHIFTAYGALEDGLAVCQGYAALYYALCWRVGLPTRIMTSSNHAWNIAYLKGIWYQLDCTWDSETDTHRKWFLLGTQNFDGGQHTRDEELRTPEFLAAYPLSLYDYDAAMPYNDVPKTNGQYANILRATERGLFGGTTAYTFSPMMNISRGMLVTVLWRLSGSPAAAGGGFSDVAAGTYYAQAVAWASKNGIVGGVGDGRFDPNGDATREQLVTILYRYARYRGGAVPETGNLSGYADRAWVDSWAQAPMRWAVGAKIIGGTTATTLSPQASATREQLAAFLIRLIDYYGF